MGTPLKAPATIGSKVASVLVQSVTVRADGAILADWQGLDAAGLGVVRQSAAFMPEAAAPLLSAPSSELVGRAEAMIVQAIASSGEAPAQNLPGPSPRAGAATGNGHGAPRGFPPRPSAKELDALTAAARARPRPELSDLHPGSRGKAPAAPAAPSSTAAPPAPSPYLHAAAAASAPSPYHLTQETIAPSDVADLPAELVASTAATEPPPEAPAVDVPADLPTEPLPLSPMTPESTMEKAAKAAAAYGAGLKR